VTLGTFPHWANDEGSPAWSHHVSEYDLPFDAARFFVHRFNRFGPLPFVLSQLVQTEIDHDPRHPGRRTAPTPYGVAPRETPRTRQLADPSETRPAPRTSTQSMINTTAEGSALEEVQVKALSGTREA